MNLDSSHSFQINRELFQRHLRQMETFRKSHDATSKLPEPAERQESNIYLTLHGLSYVLNLINRQETLNLPKN